MNTGRKIIQLLFGGWFEGEDMNSPGLCGGYMEVDEADDGEFFRLGVRERGIIRGMDGALAGSGRPAFQEVFRLRWLDKPHAKTALKDFPAGDWAWRKVDALVRTGVCEARLHGGELIISVGGRDVAACSPHPQMRAVFQ